MIKQKIIIFEDSSKVSFGGGQKITLEVCRILSSNYVFSFIDFTKDSRYVECVRERYPNSKITILKSSLFETSVPLLAKINEILCLYFWKRKNLNLLKKEINFSNSIIYATTRKALFYAAKLHKKYAVPYIYHAHLVENTKSIKYRFIKPYLKKASCVICVSQTVIKNMTGTNLKVVYNPKPLDLPCKPTKTNSHFVVAAIGSLIPIKGFEYIIEAAKFCSNIDFRIYGEGPLFSKLTKISNGAVRFMGFSKDIMKELYNSVDILVVPTIIQEALPTVIVEAKSLGIPVITTNIGGQREILNDRKDGFLVPIKNAEAIAEKINMLVSDLNLYNKMAKASYQSSEMFSEVFFENEIKKTVQNIFEEIKENNQI